MIYRFVIISGEEDSFLREFELSESNNLLDFHNALQEELEFDKSQIASFFTVNKNWEKEEEFTLIDMGANTTVMDSVIIDDIIIDPNQKLLYVFDQFNERALFIEVVGTSEPIDGLEYPACTRSVGKPPRQIVFNSFSSADLEDDYYEFDSEGNEAIDDEADLPDFEIIDDSEDI